MDCIVALSTHGHLLQSAQSLRSGVADMIVRITSWSVEKPVASGHLDKQEILTQPASRRIASQLKSDSETPVARIRATT